MATNSTKIRLITIQEVGHHQFAWEGVLSTVRSSIRCAIVHRVVQKHLSLLVNHVKALFMPLQPTPINHNESDVRVMSAGLALHAAGLRATI